MTKHKENIKNSTAPTFWQKRAFEAKLLKKKEEEERSSAEGSMTRVKRLLLRFQTLRTIAQFAFFFLFFGLFLGFGPWAVLFPVIGLLGVPVKTVGEAFGSLQYMLYMLIPPWLALASTFLAAIILSRAFCAWACPFGLVQDILTLIKRRHTQVSPRTHKQMIYLKYLILAATLLISGVIAVSVAAGIGSRYKEALGSFALAPFNTISPADTLFAVLPKTIIDARYALSDILSQPGGDISGAILNSVTSTSALFWARIFILALTFALVIYVPRGWCRYMCPQGAFSAFFSRFSFLGLSRHPARCTKAGCRDCVDVCPMLVPILDEPWEKFTHPECIMCLRCVDACSTKAIKPKFP